MVNEKVREFQFVSTESSHSHGNGHENYANKQVIHVINLEQVLYAYK